MRTALRRVLLLSCAVLAAVAVPAVSSAQAIADFERKLLPYQTSALGSLDRSFWQALSFLRAEEDRQRALKADIMFGLSGDEAGQKSLFKLNTGISLSRGIFPSELTVVSRFLLTVRDNVLQEELTSLAITYDYHTSNKFEYFAFAERFTDSFLSIQNRYEIGFGGRIGRDFGYVGTQQVADAIKTIEQQISPMQTALAAGRRAGDPVPDVAAYQRAAHNLDHINRDNQSRLFLGIAASAFAELERAEMEAISIPVTGSVSASDQIKSKVLLDSEHRYRLSIRPTIKFRPSPQVELIVFPYWKLPLDGDRYVDTPSGRRLDYRRDVLSQMTWSIKQGQTGLENVDVIFSFNHFFDNVPPRLPQSLINTAATSNRKYVATEAERSHQLVALTLKLRW